MNKWFQNRTSGSNLSLLSPRMHNLFQADPNDYDFKFTSESGFGSEQIVNEGLVKYLADKYKDKKENPRLLALELAKYQQKIAPQPSNSYIHKVFANHPVIHSTQPDLYVLFIKAFAFAKAADVSQRKSQVYFSERKISDGKIAYDCLFPEKTPSTTTAINSLFIDITALTRPEASSSIYLQSTLGDSQRLQAISDQNLGLFTFDPRQPAAKGDFARTISFFTLGGRCYQKGWLQKILEALKEECRTKSGQIPLSQVIAQQLIRRLVDHHHNEPALLVALAFNASALLLWMNSQNHNEIQKLWCLIFGHLDKLEDQFPHQMSQPLIEHIQMTMRDPQFSFKDLYAQLQVSAAVDQNSMHDNRAYPDHPTQTNGEIFQQITLSIPNRKGSHKTTSFALFFPYDLPYAIEHLSSIAHLPPQVESSLVRLHNVLISPVHLEFSFGKSRLKGYEGDLRRQHNKCIAQTRELLRTKHSYTWFMGYQLCLSLLAQHYDDGLSNHMFKSLLIMLQEKWASPQIKQSAIDILHKTMKCSFVPHAALFAGYEVNQNFHPEQFVETWIQAYLHTEWKPIVEAVLTSMDQITSGLKTERKIVLYKQWLDLCLNGSKESIKTRPLKDILAKLMTCAPLPFADKFEVIFNLSQHNTVIANLDLKNALFESMQTLLNTTKAIPSHAQAQDKEHIIDNIIALSKRMGSSDNSFKWITLAKELFRLKLVDNAASLQKIWQLLLHFTPKNSELVYIYQERSVAALKEFNLWDMLEEENKKTFSAQYLDNLKQQVTKSKNPQALLNINSVVILNKQDLESRLTVMKEVLHKALEENASFTTEDFSQCLALVEKILESEGFNPQFLFPVLISLSSKNMAPSMNTLRHTVADFQKSLKDLDRSTVIAHHLKLLALIDPNPSKPAAVAIYTAWLENLLVQIAATPATKGPTKAQNKHFIDCILKALPWGDFNQKLLELLDEHQELVYKHLQTQGLWHEIVSLYAASSDRAHPPLVYRTFIAACRHWAPLMLGKDISWKQLQGLLDQIPIEIKTEIPEQIESLYGILFDACEDNQDYPSALLCLESQKMYAASLDDFYFQRLFRTAFKLIPSDKARLVHQPLLALNTPEGYESCWMELIQLLLENNQTALCLDIIKNKNTSIGIKDDSLKDKWLALLDLILITGEDLFQAEDQSRVKQREHLYRLLDQLMWHCLPTDPKRWTSYIRMIAEKGPIDIVEKLFQNIPLEFFKNLSIDKLQRMEYWTWILERFSREASTAVLAIECWWTTLVSDISTTPKKEHQPILALCICAGHKAIHKHKVSKRLQNLAKQFASNFIESDTCMRVLTDAAEDNPRLYVYLAQICLFVNTEKYFDNALLIMVSSFMYHQLDPITEEMLINFLNSCIRIAPKYAHNQDISLKMLNLIRFITQQTQGANAHLFPILGYLHLIEKNDVMQYAQNTAQNSRESHLSSIDSAIDSLAKWQKDTQALFSEEELRVQIAKQHLLEKLTTLKMILQDPWKQLPPTDEQKRLVIKTINQCHNCYAVVIYDLLQECVQAKDIAWYIQDHKPLEKKIAHIKRQKIDFLDRFKSDICQISDEMYQASMRLQIMKRSKLEHKYYHLPSEQKAISRLSLKCMILFAILGVSSFLWYQVRSQSHTQEQ